MTLKRLAEFANEHLKVFDPLYGFDGLLFYMDDDIPFYPLT